MTQQQLADRLGVTQQSIQYACSPKGKGSKHALAISRILGVKPDWLSYGVEQPTSDNISETTPQYLNAPQNVPLIEWGQITKPETHSIATPIACPANHSDKAFALHVKDNTMTAQFGRSYPENSIIYIDPASAHKAKSGDRILALIEGKIPTFKLYGETDGERYLQSINLQYPIITKPFEIIGLVIGMWVPED